METGKLQELVGQTLRESIPPSLSATLMLRAFGFWKIPLLFSVRPTVKELTNERAVVRVPLRRWTKNHWGTMYFGTLAIGADCVVGLAVMRELWQLGAHNKVTLVFKDFHANFLKRPDGHVLFICDDTAAGRTLAQEALGTGERVNRSLKARAVLEKNPAEAVAEFTLTVSLKKK